MYYFHGQAIATMNKFDEDHLRSKRIQIR